MGVAHKSLLHNRLTISRVSVSTTLKTPNSLTFCQLRSTTNCVLPDGCRKRVHTLYDWNSSDNFTISRRHNPENVEITGKTLRIPANLINIFPLKRYIA